MFELYIFTCVKLASVKFADSKDSGALMLVRFCSGAY